MFVCYLISIQGYTIHPLLFPLTPWFWRHLFVPFQTPVVTVLQQHHQQQHQRVWWVEGRTCIVAMCRKNICESSAFLFSHVLDFSALEKDERNLHRPLSIRIVGIFPTVKNKCKTISRDTSVRFDTNNISLSYLFFTFSFFFFFFDMHV